MAAGYELRGLDRLGDGERRKFYSLPQIPVRHEPIREGWAATALITSGDAYVECGLLQLSSELHYCTLQFHEGFDRDGIHQVNAWTESTELFRLPAGLRVTDVRAGDIDGDGRSDVALQLNDGSIWAFYTRHPLLLPETPLYRLWNWARCLPFGCGGGVM